MMLVRHIHYILVFNDFNKHCKQLDSVDDVNRKIRDIQICDRFGLSKFILRSFTCVVFRCMNTNLAGIVYIRSVCWWLAVVGLCK